MVWRHLGAATSNIFCINHKTSDFQLIFTHVDFRGAENTNVDFKNAFFNPFSANSRENMSEQLNYDCSAENFYISSLMCKKWKNNRLLNQMT